MNNYNNLYKQYANHILNKSPSKTAYSFGKSQRFQSRNEEKNNYGDIVQQYEQRFILENFKKQRSDGPFQKARAAIGQSKHKKQQYENAGFQMNKTSRDFNREISKSPLKKNKQNRDCLKTQNIELIQKQLGMLPQNNVKNDYSPSKKQKPNSSKTPIKNTHRSNLSPSKSHTNLQYENDHGFKNMTVRGYYPTGIQISPNGKYPVSTIRNISSTNFAKTSSKNRYNYMTPSSDHLGPGYYKLFSQFGPN